MTKDTPSWIDESLRIRPEFSGTLVHPRGRVPGVFWMQPAHQSLDQTSFDTPFYWRTVYQWELNAKVELDASKPDFSAESLSWFNPKTTSERWTLVTDVSEKELVHGTYRFNAMVLKVYGSGQWNLATPARGKIVVKFGLRTSSGVPFIVPWSVDVAEVVSFEHGQLDGLGWEGYYDWCMEHQWPERAAALAVVHQNSRPH